METNSKIIRSFRDSLDKVSIPFITLDFIVGGELKSYNFVIDTGASDCFIDCNVAKSFDNVVNLEENYCSLYSSTGTQNNLGLLVLNFFCDSHSFSQRFLCNDFSESRKFMREHYEMDFVGMIGVNFFRRYKAVINYTDCTISFNTKYDCGKFSLKYILQSA